MVAKAQLSWPSVHCSSLICAETRGKSGGGAQIQCWREASKKLINIVILQTGNPTKNRCTFCPHGSQVTYLQVCEEEHDLYGCGKGRQVGTLVSWELVSKNLWWKEEMRPSWLPAPPLRALWFYLGEQRKSNDRRFLRQKYEEEGQMSSEAPQRMAQTSSLRNTDTGDNIVSKCSGDTHGTPAEQDLFPNALTKLNWIGVSSGPRAHPGGRHGNPLQYSCLKNPTEGTGGLQSTGLLHRVKSTWHTCTRAHGPNEILFQ